ncbi:MAG: hypothetical protein A2288_00695 [Candidatus Moranbacteria bacterium RIFOXYA12_FULL_44_15]|nr:MAG: hypothetical protein A2288_00695 [Candidatus Moranbacteria bacterium RIFOXYA12_FULL_44_15]OGI35049.1 MAG: hypothetical protein A2259_04710 [Candidatus Moranbacteria bacterium RIFOXYA2_FULL_43_15]
MIDISKYYIVILPLVVLTIIRIIKFIIFFIRHGYDFNYALEHGVTYGHMPSAHTGFVVSLVTSVGYYEGLNTGAFAVAVTFAILIIDDAVRLRMYLGDQGRYINMLTQELNISEDKFPRLKERVGHRKAEIVVGGILGFILTLAFATALS